MKKTKLLALCSVSPVLISSIPLFSTSCSNEEHIIVSDEIKFQKKEDFITWKDKGMYEGFVKNVKQWTASDFNTNVCIPEEADVKSVYDSEVLAEYEKNFNSDTARAALGYSIGQSCAYDVNQMKGIEFPAILTYSLDVSYDKKDKSVTGMLSSEFSSSNDAKFSCSLYMPEALKIAGSYGVEIDGINHNVVVLKTKNGKNSVESQSVATLADGTTITTSIPQSYARLDFSIFFNKNLSTFIGPNNYSEIFKFNGQRPEDNATEYSFTLSEEQIKEQSRKYYGVENVKFDINYDKLENVAYSYPSYLSIEENSETHKYTIKNTVPSTVATTRWPSAIYLNASIPDRTGGWVVTTINLYGGD